MAAQVFTPEGFDRRRIYPLLVLFPGRGGDETSWMGGRIGSEGVGIDGIAASLIGDAAIEPVIIVSANIDDSYGVDSSPSSEGYDHGAYERYIVDDLLPWIQTRYPNADPKRRFVGGLSMGGFAALHVGLRRPDLFAGIGVLSPAIFEGTIPDRAWLFGGTGGRDGHDPLLLAQTAEVSGRFFVGWGDRDYGWISSASAVLADRLSSRGVDSLRQVVPGGHAEGTWRALAPTLLRQLFGASR
jgi:enterochelin esterase-like enzyme